MSKPPALRLPRPGDRIVASGTEGSYRVEAVDRKGKRLLVRDHDGDVFVIRSFRLNTGGWSLVPSLESRRTDRLPSGLAQVRVNSRRRRAA